MKEKVEITEEGFHGHGQTWWFHVALVYSICPYILLCSISLVSLTDFTDKCILFSLAWSSTCCLYWWMWQFVCPNLMAYFRQLSSFEIDSSGVLVLTWLLKVLAVGNLGLNLSNFELWRKLILIYWDIIFVSVSLGNNGLWREIILGVNSSWFHV